MILIVNADINWGIGKNNRLLFSNSADMRFFREKTMGGAVVMGRKTLESLPGGKPLPGRTNIVLTRNAAYENSAVTVCRTRKELAAAVGRFDPDKVFLIGGASVYNAFMDCCSAAFVTRTLADGGADCFINPLDGRGGWRIVSESEVMTSDGVEFKLVEYVNDTIASL